MAQIYNSDLTKELVQGSKLQQARDIIPNQLADKVVPVMEVNPKLLRTTNLFKAGVLSDAVSATIFTASIDRETYIQDIWFSYKTDVNATATNFNVSAVIDGATQNLVIIRKNNLTAEKDSGFLSFDSPIKIDKGSIVTVTSDTNVASFRFSVCFTGFTVENYKS